MWSIGLVFWNVSPSVAVESSNMRFVGLVVEMHGDYSDPLAHAVIPVQSNRNTSIMDWYKKLRMTVYSTMRGAWQCYITWLRVSEMLRHTVVGILDTNICGFSNYTFAVCFSYLSWVQTWFNSLCLHHLWRWNRVFRNVGTSVSYAGKSPKRNNTILFFLFLYKVWGKGCFQQGFCKNKIKNYRKKSIPMETVLIRKITNVRVKWFPLFMKAIIQYEYTPPPPSQNNQSGILSFRL